MNEKQICTRLALALRSELENRDWSELEHRNRQEGFFCRWFKQRRLAWEKADGWGRLNALYAPEMDAARRREYLSAARSLLSAEKHLSVDRKRWDRLLNESETEPTQRLLDELHRVLLNAYAMKDAKTYYYDTFEPGRKKSRDLELLDAFCMEAGLTLRDRSGEGRMSAEELADWDKLVKLLRAQGQENVFLPVCADPHSGAGLYLVGLKNIPWGEDQRRRRRDVKSCYFLFLTPSDLPENDADEPFQLELEEERKVGEEIVLEDYDFHSVKEAESWFWGTAALRATACLHDWNDEAPAGCPKRFLDRFYTSRREEVLSAGDREELARQGRLAFQAGSESEKAGVSR